MKKQIKFTGLVFFLTFASLQAQMSYYYGGKKINLTVDRNYVYIIADEIFYKSASTNQMLQSLNLESEENKTDEGMTKLSPLQKVIFQKSLPNPIFGDTRQKYFSR